MYSTFCMVSVGCLQKDLRLNLNQQDFHNYMTPPDLVDKGDDETAKHIDFDVMTKSALYN